MSNPSFPTHDREDIQPIPDTEQPSWGENEIFNWFADNNVLFPTEPGGTSSDIDVMKTCFTALVHRQGILFYKVCAGEKVYDPDGCIIGSALLSENDIEISVTHDDLGQSMDLIGPFSCCAVDWLGRHIDDKDLRSQVMRPDEEQ